MRVLFVEDEEKIRAFVKKGLEAECFSIDLASDGREGIELTELNDYDVVILDNILPYKTGYEICAELRKKDCSMPILILSVQADTNDKVRALNAGADDYLTKPFSMQELVARIRALLRRPSHVEGDVLEVHGVTLDLVHHVAKKNGKEIHLTKKEFMLLEYLMRNQSFVLTRSMIMEHVWDMNADPFSNTIESHILSLRRKIGSSKHDPIIQTVPGRGYKIE